MKATKSKKPTRNQPNIRKWLASGAVNHIRPRCRKAPPNTAITRPEWPMRPTAYTDTDQTLNECASITPKALRDNLCFFLRTKRSIAVKAVIIITIIIGDTQITPRKNPTSRNQYDQFRTNKWSTTKTSLFTEMWLESLHRKTRPWGSNSNIRSCHGSISLSGFTKNSFV